VHAALQREVRGIGGFDFLGLVGQQPGKYERTAWTNQGAKAWRQLHERSGENIGQQHIGAGLRGQGVRKIKRQPFGDLIALGVFVAHGQCLRIGVGAGCVRRAELERGDR
jgi:hypothetical protein